MKNIVFFLLLITVMLQSCGNAKEKIVTDSPKRPAIPSIQVSGKLMEQNRVIQLSPNVQRLLFLLENGNVLLPETAYFLMLSPEDAKRLKKEYILLIPSGEMDATNFAYEYNKKFSFEVIPLPGMEDVYYANNNDYFFKANALKDSAKKTIYPKSIFSNPSLKDTLTWSDFGNYKDLRDIPQWIEKLDSKENVTVHHIGCAETTTGGYTFHTYEKMSLAEFAKQRLGYVHSQMETLGAPSAESPKKDWKNWMDSLQSISLKDKFPAFTGKTMTFNEFGHGLFATDATTGKIIRLNEKTEYKNYEDQQVVSFDTKGIATVGNISNEKQEAGSFEAVFAENDTLYTLSQNLVWGKYSPRTHAGKTFYKILGSKNLNQNATNEAEVLTVFQNQHTTFVVYKKEKSEALFLLSLRTKTGALIAEKSLTELARENQLYHGEIDILTLKYTNNRDAIWNLNLQSGNNKYQLKLDDNLNLMTSNPLPDDWPTYHYLLSAEKNTSLYAEVVENSIMVQKVTDGKPIYTENISLSEDYIFDTYYFVTEGNDIRLVYEFDDVFTHGIKTVLLDASQNYKPGKSQLIYSFVPVENLSSENIPINLYFSILKDKKNCFFSIDNELYHVIF